MSHRPRNWSRSWAKFAFLSTKFYPNVFANGWQRLLIAMAQQADVALFCAGIHEIFAGSYNTEAFWLKRGEGKPSPYWYCSWLMRHHALIGISSTQEFVGEHKRCIRVAQGVAQSNSSLLSQLLSMKLPGSFTHTDDTWTSCFNIVNSVVQILYNKKFPWLHHQHAQYQYESRLCNWIWLYVFIS